MTPLFIKFIRHISILMAGIIIPAGVIWSCGPTLSTDESRFALFRPQLDNNSGLSPFNYSESLFNFTEADPARLDYTRNCAEWLYFCGGSVKRSDIYDVQYKISGDSFLLSYNERNLHDFKNNTFINWLIKKENYAALKYMVLAKDAERTQFKNATDPWDTSLVKTDIKCESIAENASQALGLSLPLFLKERYAFQAIKMYYYAGTNQGTQLHKLYQEYLQPSRSIVAAWALVYYGMSQTNSNNRAKFLLQAFDKTEEKKEFCYLHLSNMDLSALEKVTTDTNLLMLSTTLRALKNKGRALTQLKTVYQYDPNSKYLPLLITREINKLENWLWSPEMLYFSENYRPEFEGKDNLAKSFKQKLKEKDIQYLQEVKMFIENITSKNKSYKTFKQLALAHLYNMQHDFTKAGEILQGMDEHLNPMQQTQRLIEQVITTAQLKDIANPVTQQTLAIFITKLVGQNPAFKQQMDKQKYSIWEHEGDNESDDDLSELLVLLSHIFEKKGDRVMAGLLYNKANVTVNNYDGWVDSNKVNYRNIAYFDRYASPNDIDKLLAFSHKKNKTQFEQLVSPQPSVLDDQYKDLKGTILFRQKNFTQALSVFESMDPHFWVNHYEYKNYLPLTTITYAGTMFPSEKVKQPKYSQQSKALITKDIVNLLTAIPRERNSDKKALLYYKLANAWFNTTYNGRAWMMFSYGKSLDENYKRGTGNYHWAGFDFYPNGATYGDGYYRCSDAIAMYKKALSFTTDKELAAKCLLSLSVCDKIKHDNIKSLGNSPWTNNNVAYFSGYLQQLKMDYRTTNTFKEAAIECPDVKGFLKKR